MWQGVGVVSFEWDNLSVLYEEETFEWRMELSNGKTMKISKGRVF